MIEAAYAKNGSLIHLKDGKYLASSFDPQKEAEAWWRSSQRLTKYARTLFVLGLGSGFHIEVARREMPDTKIVVIEIDQQLIDLFKANSNELKNTEIICEADWRKLFQHSSISGGVQDKYAVLLHPPSLSVEKEYFANAYKFLLARSVEGLFALLKTRPDLLSELDEAKLADLARTGDAVTIRTLTSSMKTTAYLNENRRIWKVLEDLIA